MGLPDVLCLLCVCWAVPEPPPPAADLLRFPAQWLCEKNTELAHEHMAWALRQQDLWKELYPLDAGYWQQWWEEAYELYLHWYFLSQAWWHHEQGRKSLDGWGEAERHENEVRDFLRILRERIGWKAYYEGAMPPPVPIWRFRRMP